MDKRNEKTSIRIAELIKNDIEIGFLKPNEKLPSERELVKKFNVSRSSIREAVKHLSAMGYIETFERRGNFVSDKYLDNDYANTQLNKLLRAAPIFDLMETRMFLEEKCIILAIKRATEKDLNKMRDAVIKMKKSDDLSDFYEADSSFHLSLAEATHNIVIIELMKVIIMRTNENKDYFVPTGLQTRHNTIKIFEKLIKNLSAKNLEEAKRLHHTHLLDVKYSLQRSL